MSKKFILSTDVLTAEQEQRLKTKLSELGFWHWLPNFWLLKSVKDEIVVTDITAMVQQVAPLARCFAAEVQPVFWAARTRPDANGNDMAKWIRETWQTP